jgi:hypothetical protein
MNPVCGEAIKGQVKRGPPGSTLLERVGCVRFERLQIIPSLLRRMRLIANDQPLEDTRMTRKWASSKEVTHQHSLVRWRGWLAPPRAGSARRLLVDETVNNGDSNTSPARTLV